MERRPEAAVPAAARPESRPRSAEQSEGRLRWRFAIPAPAPDGEARGATTIAAFTRAATSSTTVIDVRGANPGRRVGESGSRRRPPDASPEPRAPGPTLLLERAQARTEPNDTEDPHADGPRRERGPGRAGALLVRSTRWRAPRRPLGSEQRIDHIGRGLPVGAVAAGLASCLN
jgi:hypothetical protein